MPRMWFPPKAERRIPAALLGRSGQCVATVILLNAYDEELSMRDKPASVVFVFIAGIMGAILPRQAADNAILTNFP